jgi:hypothetical protein
VRFSRVALVGLCAIAVRSQSPVSIDLDSPRDYQVFQRESRDSGSILIAGRVREKCNFVVASIDGSTWRNLAYDPTLSTFHGEVSAPAGGFYRVEVRCGVGDVTFPGTVVSHVGIGEVFVVAGQSNATNYGEVKQTTRTRMVTAFDGDVHAWRIADDPQPGVQDNSSKGSFIPAFGDALYEKYHVPIGIADVGHGSTSVRQWLPPGEHFAVPPTMSKYVYQTSTGEWESAGTLFDGMIRTIRQLGPHGFRALLWHQGESDAHQQAGHQMTGAEYRGLLAHIIEASRQNAWWDFPWFVAQASYHTPADPATPEIREAQRSLWEAGIALEGPDTDQLTGLYRQNNGTGVHMSDAGLKAHGRLWAEKVHAWLDRVLND